MENAEWTAKMARERLDELVAFIKDHGHYAEVRGETIVAELHYEFAVEWSPKYATAVKLETIENPTFKTVRDWLGY